MADAGGPRESWHDMHCNVEELAADAILNHVEQHWRKVALWHKTEQNQKDSMIESISYYPS
jgi:hypothetical protein